MRTRVADIQHHRMIVYFVFKYHLVCHGRTDDKFPEAMLSCNGIRVIAGRYLVQVADESALGPGCGRLKAGE